MAFGGPLLRLRGRLQPAEGTEFSAVELGESSRGMRGLPRNPFPPVRFIASIALGILYGPRWRRGCPYPSPISCGIQPTTLPVRGFLPKKAMKGPPGWNRGPVTVIAI